MSQSNGRPAFKKTVTSEDARNDRRIESHNHRKRRKDAQLQKARLGGSPEKQAKKARDRKTMTDVEALDAIMKFWKSNPGESDFRSLMENSVEGIKTFRRALTEGKSGEIMDNIVNAGLLEQLFFLLDLSHFYDKYGDFSKDETVGTLQFEAAWCLTNIAATHRTTAIMQFPESLHILGRAIYHSRFPNVREQAMWCLANLVGYEGKNSVLYRKQILDHSQIVEGMVLNIQKPANPSILKTSIWAIANTVQGRRSPGLNKVRPLVEVILGVYVEVTQSNGLPIKERDEILEEIFSALRKGMMHDTDVVEYVGVSASFIPLTLAVLKQARQNGNVAVMVRGMRCIGLLLSDGSHDVHSSLMNHDFLAEANQLLQQSNEHLLKEVCAGLASFLAYGDSQRIKKFRSRGCLSNVVEVANKAPWQAKKEALQVLYNFLRLTDHNGHRHFFSTGVGIQVLCDSLESTKNLDVSLCKSALEAIETLLQVDRENDEELGVCKRLAEFRGLATIEGLQLHNVTDVRIKAIHIIEAFFVRDENEVDEDELAFGAPPLVGTSYGLGLKSSPAAPASYTAKQKENRSSLLG